MASNMYNTGKAEILKGNIDLDGGDIRVLLVTSSYTPNADHDDVADVSTYEVSGTGYSRKTLSSLSVTVDDTNDRAVFDAADVVWTGLNSTSPAYAIVYKYDATDANAILIACIDFTDYTPSGNDWTLEWNANGIFYW